MARRVLHDRYFKQAKAEGYAARSAYKLLEIQDRHRLIRAGQRVLDLGCAPGSWLQVAAELVGERGVVVGIDLLPVEAAVPDHVHAIRGDAFAIDPAELRGASGLPFDVVLSDMMANTSGAGDDLVSARLCRQILERVPALLRPGGHLVMKIFEGSEYPGVLREAGSMFRHAKGLKPRATREISREMYIIAEGFRPPHAPPPGVSPASPPGLPPGPPAPTP